MQRESIPKLVDANGLLIALFEKNSRPSVRWVRDQQKSGGIPYKRIGRLIFFDPEEVLWTLAERTKRRRARGSR